MKIPLKIAVLAQTLLLLASVTGCKTVVRENIISSIDTGLGVTLAENPKTELYEAKVGYIRSQFYSVPTAKNVETTGDPSHLSNDASTTPDLVSGIRVQSDARQLLLGVNISESFAVGKVAVMSPAAVAMYISDAKDVNTASAAAQATASTTAMASVRDPAFVAQTTQARVDNILTKIDKLSDASAIDLEKNPPVKDPDVDKIVALRDPTNQRATVGSAARQILKMRAVLSGKRSEQELSAWEAAVKSAE